MSTWRVAKSLTVLRDQINSAFPKRDKSSDGTLGDDRHAATKSEHNPDANGVVRAMDISNDPSHGVVSDRIAHQLVDSRDPRILYVISNAKISNPTIQDWKWRDYTGSNPHDHHFHISVVASPKLYDSMEPWKLNFTATGPVLVPPVSSKPKRQTVKLGATGQDVAYLQRMLGLKDTATFDDVTDKAVVAFQKKYGLVPDGIVGPYTWGAIEK